MIDRNRDNDIYVHFRRNMSLLLLNYCINTRIEKLVRERERYLIFSSENKKNSETELRKMYSRYIG